MASDQNGDGGPLRCTTPQSESSSQAAASRRPWGLNNVLKHVGSHVDDGPKLGVFVDVEAMKQQVRESLMRPVYSVFDFYYTEGYFQAIAKSKIFETVTMIVICMNAIWIAVDTDYNPADSLLQSAMPFQVGEHLFASISPLRFSFASVPSGTSTTAAGTAGSFSTPSS